MRASDLSNEDHRMPSALQNQKKKEESDTEYELYSVHYSRAANAVAIRQLLPARSARDTADTAEQIQIQIQIQLRDRDTDTDTDTLSC